MKFIRNSIWGGVALVVTLCLVHAQSDSSSTITTEDTATMIEAIEQVAPTPGSSLPSVGTFWSAQHAPGTLGAWPPLPGNMLGLDAWPLGDGQYLLDDTNVDYAEVQAEADAAAAAAAPMSRMSMVASSLATAYAYSNPVYLTNMAANIAGDGSVTASFNVAGGTNFVPYDILMTTNLATPVGSWNWIGIGYTSNRYTFGEENSGLGFYILAKPSKTMTVGIGNDTDGQCDVPFGLTNVLQVVGGGGQSLALKNDGTVVAWGANYYGEGVVPTNLNGVAMIGAGWYHNVAMLTNGTVTAWGFNLPVAGYPLTEVPANLTNATVVSVQALHTLALRSNGTVVAWGYSSSFGETNVPAGLSNVVAISAGYQFNLVVVTNGNGTVVAWGDNTAGQCNVPSGLSNVVDVAAGTFQSLALLRNGTVAAWGDNTYGETNVPANATNVVAISAGGDPTIDTAYCMALKGDGTVILWGSDDAVDPVGGMNHVIAVGAGADHALVIRTGPPTPVVTLEPTNQYQVPAGSVTFAARGAGLYGVTYQWQTNGVNLSGATNATLTITNVQVAQLQVYGVVVTDDGGWGSILSSNASLAFVTPPVIISQTPMPTNQVAIYQSNLVLNVEAYAPGIDYGFPLSYQWQFNGTNILYANSAAYTIHPTINSFGTYSVLVSNAAGSTNAAWLVTVYYPGLLISQQPTNQYQIAGGNVTFMGGGIASNSVTYQWAFNGTNIIGATNISLTLTNVQTAQQGSYNFTISDGVGSLTSSNASFTLVTPPVIVSPTLPTNQIAVVSSNLTLNVVASAPGATNGFPLAYQWQLNGANIYGATGSNYTFAPSAPGIYSVTVTNAAGSTNVTWWVNMPFPGNCFAWGDNDSGQSTPPFGITNIAAIGAGEYHVLAVEDSGKVIQWGYDWAAVPADLTNAVAVAGGYDDSIALRKDGTIETWGAAYAWGDYGVPTNLTGVKAIAAGFYHDVTLLTNGTLVAWGYSGTEEGWNLTNIPPGLTNVTAISAEGFFTLALQNGTVTAWGDNEEGETNVPAGLSNVVAVAAGGYHCLALKANGTVVAWGDNTSGQTNVPPGLTNVMAIAAGYNHSVALKNDGTLVSWGDNTYAETNIPSGLTNVKLIAAGEGYTVASEFSQTVSYPVDVTKDLLLVYYTYSTNSTFVLNYYLANRPMVAGANVLGLGCPGIYITNAVSNGNFLSLSNITDYESIYQSDFTNQILNPILNWLAVNPTKRPQYIVLMLDVPSAINYTATNALNYPFYVGYTNGSVDPSVSYQLSTSVTGWQPFINHINMYSTNDCIAYINKLHNMGTNSPGELIISASAVKYGNTNWYFDDTRDLGYSGLTPGTNAYTGVVQAGASSQMVTYTNIYPDCGSLSCHITSGTNIAGYLCWGEHSSLNAEYATGEVNFTGNSAWYLIQTMESFNGQRYEVGQGNFTQWFLSNAFGGSGYSNTPVGGLSYVEEPGLGAFVSQTSYFGFWEAGKNFAMCAWAKRTSEMQIIGDPFVKK